jgi:hypothetical protein
MKNFNKLYESILSSLETTAVIADKVTGDMWGGIFKGDKPEEKLARVIKMTKNKNYAIMDFKDAEAIAKKYKKVKK